MARQSAAGRSHEVCRRAQGKRPLSGRRLLIPRARMNTLLSRSPAVRTTCPYCGVGCGVIAKPDGHGGAAISGDSDHPANLGRLCSKGSTLNETLGLDHRLLHPMLRRPNGTVARTDWNIALDRVAGGLRPIIDAGGPRAGTL